MEGTAELLGTQRALDGTKYLETFCIRVYPLNSSKLNGTVGVHVSLALPSSSDCRDNEVLKVSGELKVRNHYITQFANDLIMLLSGSLNQVTLEGGNKV
jgi:hypothetical protein